MSVPTALNVLAGQRLSGCETLQRADACLWGILPESARADRTPGDIRRRHNAIWNTDGNGVTAKKTMLAIEPAGRADGIKALLSNERNMP
jgi:hypothetical protein